MRTELDLQIDRQPDMNSCGPTCLRAIYRYYGDEIPLDTIARQVGYVENGGTLAVLLACHALKRGYKATIYTYNLQVYDPTWFADPSVDIRAKLALQLQAKPNRPKLDIATHAYREYIKLGGTLKFEDLSSELIGSIIGRGTPILTGLSSTYLYRACREWGAGLVDDDVRGEPQGHFTVLYGFDGPRREVMVADPLDPNPPFHSMKYRIGIDRLISSILLGILTYDANLLIIEPAKAPKKPPPKGARARRPKSS